MKNTELILDGEKKIELGGIFIVEHRHSCNISTQDHLLLIEDDKKSLRLLSLENYTMSNIKYVSGNFVDDTKREIGKVMGKLDCDIYYITPTKVKELSLPKVDSSFIY